MAGDVLRSIEQIASSSMQDNDGTVRGTKKIFGYVCAINTEGELAGTVDVQEFNYEPGEYSKPGAGHHRGVLLSAIQDNQSGFLIVPMLYSEVVIVQNSLDGTEYVIMYSHAKKMQLLISSVEDDKDSSISIGVTEVKNFVETDDGLEMDYFELEKTQNATNTTYTASSIVDNIVSPDDSKGYREERTAEHKVITVKNTTITIDGENISIETSGKVKFKIGSTTVTHQDGQINIKADNVKLESTNCELKGDNVKVEGANVTITGGNLKTQGMSSADLNGPFNAVKVCPFSGAPHCGSMVSGT